MITPQKIGQSGKTTTIIVAISIFRLPFGDNATSIYWGGV